MEIANSYSLFPSGQKNKTYDYKHDNLYDYKTLPCYGKEAGHMEGFLVHSVMGLVKLL